MSIVSPLDLSPTDSLRSTTAKQLWHSDAPPALRSAWERGDQAEAWATWVKHLKGLDLKGRNLKTRNSSGSSSFSLAWGAPPEFLRFQETVLQKEGGLIEWLSKAASRETDLLFAIESLAWADRLAQIAPETEPSVWWDLCEQLTGIAAEAAASQAADQPTATEAIIQQLLAGELPLALSIALPELKPLKDLRPTAIDRLAEGLERLTDGEGLLHTDLLDATLLLLACWTRCRLRCESQSDSAWPDDAETQLEWLVRQVLRLVDGEGQLPFSDNQPPTDNLKLLQAALDLAGDEEDKAAARRRLTGCQFDSEAKPPSPSNHSEWAGLTVMATGWPDKAPRLTVTHDGEQMRIALRANRKTLFSGDWPVRITVEGKPLKPVDEWEVSCWHSDEDCDYLELSIDLTGGATLERHLLIAREDGVAMLSEVLLTESGEAIPLALTTSLPLAEGGAFVSEEETRDGWILVGDQRVAGVLPLALSEWKVEARGGSLEEESGRLRLHTESSGRNLASPLWIDFSLKRFAKQRTWRQLTVAEALKKVPTDVAVGYRVQSGKKQWILYRSLAPPANRTLLGHNLSSEALIGRFLKTGEVDEYIEIGEDD